MFGLREWVTNKGKGLIFRLIVLATLTPTDTRLTLHTNFKKAPSEFKDEMAVRAQALLNMVEAWAWPKDDGMDEDSVAEHVPGD